MPLETGQHLSHYRLIEKIGEGGMGVVWKAADTKLDREVALKLLPDELATDPDRLARFQREAKLLASLNHPNVGSIYGLEADGSRHFLVLELIPGRSLSEMTRRGPLPVEEALDLARQVAEGLEAAHRAGVVHRDLKPDNVRVTPDGTVKVLDFGLAKGTLGEDPVSGADLSMSPTLTKAGTKDGMILGTAPYMSPEQARGKPIDKRTDIWSFACLLYECLTGKAPFRGETVTDVLALILQAEPDWSKLPADTPVATRRLLRRCMVKDPHQRIHDIADARIELQEAPEPAMVPPAPAPGRGGRAALGWGLLGLIVGMAPVAWLGQRLAETERPPLRPARHLAIPTPGSRAVFPLPDTPTVTISPDGERLVYVSGGTEVGASHLKGDTPGRGTTLFMRRLDRYESAPIGGTYEATAPFFSPDGQWLGYADYRTGKLKKLSLRGGAPVSLCDVTLNFRGATWGQDDRIYLARFAGGIEVIPAGGGTPEQLTFPDREAGVKTHRYPSVLPGARGLLFTLASAEIASYDDASIALLPLPSGEIRILLEGGTSPRYSPTGHIIYAREGSLLAVPFDLETMQVHGTPFPVLDGVITSDGYGSAQFGFSEDGTLAYVPGGPDHYYVKLYWLDRNGGVEPLALSSNMYGDVRFSPDGKRLAVSILGANASVWNYHIERETMTRLTSHWDNYNPIWTRDGRNVTFASNRGGTPAIWQVRSDGGGRPQRLKETVIAGYPESWSPGDRTLFLTQQTPLSGSGIWSWSPGQEVQVLLDSPAQEYYSTLSPDGEWVAYVSDESGQAEVYVAPASFSGRKWRISADGGDAPRWSPDGRRLFYWRETDLMTASIAVDDGIIPGRPERLIETRFTEVLTYDIAPDGERFIVAGRVEEPGAEEVAFSTAGWRRNRPARGVSEIRVIVDWFDEIRRAASRSGS